MATSSTFFSPFLFLCVLVLSDVSLAVSLDPGTKLKNVPENNNHLQNQEMWLQQSRSGHHHKHGLAKKERVHAMPSRGQPAGEETLRMGSGAPAVEELVAEGQPAALKQNKDVFLGFEFPYPERENQSPGSERGKKQNREHRRHSRRDRLKHHRGIWAPREPEAVGSLEMSVTCMRARWCSCGWATWVCGGCGICACSGEKSAKQKRHKKKGEIQNQRFLLLAESLWKWPGLPYRGTSENSYDLRGCFGVGCFGFFASLANGSIYEQTCPSHAQSLHWLWNMTRTNTIRPEIIQNSYFTRRSVSSHQNLYSSMSMLN